MAQVSFQRGSHPVLILFILILFYSTPYAEAISTNDSKAAILTRHFEF